jgi:cytidylate kinase
LQWNGDQCISDLKRFMNRESRVRKVELDIAGLSIYDLVVDTGTLSEDGMFQTVKVAINDIRN